MALTYPLAHPTTPGFTGIDWQRVSVVGESKSSDTGQRQVSVGQGQWWMASFTLPPMKTASAEPWAAWITGLNGKQGTFLLGDSIRTTPRGVGTGTPLVNGGSQAGYDLVTDGWTASQTGILKAGDWLQLGSGVTARLHKVMADCNSNGSGQATVTIWPALRTAPTDNAAIVVNNAKGLFSLQSNIDGWSVDKIRLYGMTVNAIEVLT